MRSVVYALALAAAAPAAAQEAQPARVAFDTSATFDETVDASGRSSTGITLDSVASISFGRGFEAIVRPIVQRLGNGDWNNQIWVATVRYQRAGNVGVRVDAGLIPSPVGLGNLMLRSHLNPTIFLPSSLFTSLPAFALRNPRLTLLGAVYGMGASATVSGAHWDVRAAVVDTSPLRTRRVFARPNTNPPRFPTVVVGGGVTPLVGIRVGASVTRTGWQRAGEAVTGVGADRDATMVTIESEASFRYTRLQSEWVRDTLETTGERQVASGWFVQGQQTLTPRWFVAARGERMSAPALGPPLNPFNPLVQQRLAGFEGTVGFRVTPELTLRLSHRGRRGFGRPGADHQTAVSVVWWKRWL